MRAFRNADEHFHALCENSFLSRTVDFPNGHKRACGLVARLEKGRYIDGGILLCGACRNTGVYGIFGGHCLCVATDFRLYYRVYSFRGGRGNYRRKKGTAVLEISCCGGRGVCR